MAETVPFFIGRAYLHGSMMKERRWELIDEAYARGQVALWRGSGFNVVLEKVQGDDTTQREIIYKDP